MKIEIANKIESIIISVVNSIDPDKFLNFPHQYIEKIKFEINDFQSYLNSEIEKSQDNLKELEKQKIVLNSDIYNLENKIAPKINQKIKENSIVLKETYNNLKNLLSDINIPIDDLDKFINIVQMHKKYSISPSDQKNPFLNMIYTVSNKISNAKKIYSLYNDLQEKIKSDDFINIYNNFFQNYESISQYNEQIIDLTNKIQTLENEHLEIKNKINNCSENKKKLPILISNENQKLANLLLSKKKNVYFSDKEKIEKSISVHLVKDLSENDSIAIDFVSQLTKHFNISNDKINDLLKKNNINYNNKKITL